MQVCCHKNLFQKVLKVTSHQEETQFSHLVDAWAARGNDAADETAPEAFELLPQAVLVAHVKLKHKTALRYAACRALHTMFVDIGKRVVAEKKHKIKRSGRLGTCRAMHPSNDGNHKH